MVGSLSSVLMTGVTGGRNAFSGGSSVQWGLRVVVGTPCFLLVATVGAVETVAYTMFAAMALPIYPLTIGPFTFFGERLKSSSFTALWAVAVATVFNRRPIDLPVQESGARVYAETFNPTAIPLSNPTPFIQSILDEMKGLKGNDYSDPEFFPHLFEAVIFGCLRIQDKNNFFLNFLKEETVTALSQIVFSFFDKDDIQEVKGKIFEDKEITREISKELWLFIANIASKEAQGSKLNSYLGKVFGVDSRTPNLSFEEIFYFCSYIFVVFLGFLKLQLAPGKSLFRGKILGYIEVGYLCGQILEILLTIQLHRPDGAFARVNPRLGVCVFLSNILILYNKILKIFCQVKNVEFFPFLPFLTKIVSRIDAYHHFIMLGFYLVRGGPGNIFEKMAYIFEMALYFGGDRYRDVPNYFTTVSGGFVAVSRLYSLILKQST